MTIGRPATLLIGMSPASWNSRPFVWLIESNAMKVAAQGATAANRMGCNVSDMRILARARHKWGSACRVDCCVKRRGSLEVSIGWAV